MIRFLVYVIIGYLVWKIVRLIRSSGSSPVQKPGAPPPEYPQDGSFKHIQDADFKDISSDPEKPS